VDLLLGAAAFGGGMAAMRAFDRLRVARTLPRGRLPADLPWAYFVAPGVIQLKDGAFLTGFRFRGPDTASATNAELNALSAHLNRALYPFYEDWVLHFDAVRRRSFEYPDAGAFPDRVTWGIDEERRREYARSGRKYETECVLSLTWRPPADRSARTRRWFVQGEESGDTWERHLQRYMQDGVERLLDLLGTRLHLEPMGSDEYLTHLHFCLTGLEHKVLAPPDASHLDWALASQEFTRGTRPRIGGKHIYAVSIFGFAPESWSGILDPLTKVGAPYRWSTRVVPLSYATAARIIGRIRDTWFKNRKGAATLTQGMFQSGEKTQQQIEDEKVFENTHARQAAARLSDVLGALQSGRGRAALYTSTLIVHGDSDAEARDVARQLMHQVNERGFTARVEGLHACSAFFSSMPGNGWHNLRRPALPTENIADLLPVTASWAGLRYVPSPYFPVRSPALAYVDTDDSTPFRLNLYHKDVGHSLLVGSTGAGKSTFMGFCVSQFMRYPDAQVFWFDKGHSAYLLTAAMGGHHYDIRPKPDPRSGLQFQPYARVDDAEERAYYAEWTETVAHLQGVEPSLAKRRAIQRALAVLGDRPPEERTIRAFVMHVQDLELRAAMEQYTGTGPSGYLLDGARDGFASGNVHTFEMHRLMSVGDRVVVPVLLHLFRQIELRLRSNRPTFIPIDEAWEALTRSLFAARIEEWLRTIRKANGAVMLATQDPADVAKSDHRGVILSSCPTMVFLPNPNAVSEDVAKLYRAYKLNNREVEIVATGETKRDYFFKSPDGSRRFELKLGPVALAFLGSRPGMTTAASVDRAKRLQAIHGPEWPRVWLEEAGLHAQAAEMYPATAARAA
jgi:type IV secretion/conjugal transfer VirB4 family ATPase